MTDRICNDDAAGSSPPTTTTPRFQLQRVAGKWKPVPVCEPSWAAPAKEDEGLVASDCKHHMDLSDSDKLAAATRAALAGQGLVIDEFELEEILMGGAGETSDSDSDSHSLAGGWPTRYLSDRERIAAATHELEMDKLERDELEMEMANMEREHGRQSAAYCETYDSSRRKEPKGAPSLLRRRPATYFGTGAKEVRKAFLGLWSTYWGIDALGETSSSSTKSARIAAPKKKKEDKSQPPRLPGEEISIQINDEPPRRAIDIPDSELLPPSQIQPNTKTSEQPHTKPSATGIWIQINDDPPRHASDVPDKELCVTHANSPPSTEKGKYSSSHLAPPNPWLTSRLRKANFHKTETETETDINHGPKNPHRQANPDTVSVLVDTGHAARSRRRERAEFVTNDNAAFRLRRFLRSKLETPTGDSHSFNLRPGRRPLHKLPTIAEDEVSKDLRDGIDDDDEVPVIGLAVRATFGKAKVILATKSDAISSSSSSLPAARCTSNPITGNKEADEQKTN